jgi:hypothetical protein
LDSISGNKGDTMRNRLILSLITFVLSSQFIAAGVVTGRVTDSRSGDFLPGANVFLEATNYGTSSDRTGSFSINGVAEGDYTLRVSYIGYSDYTNSVTVGSDPVNENVQLNVSYVAMDAVNVSGLAQGQAKALSQQRSAGNIKM